MVVCSRAVLIFHSTMNWSGLKDHFSYCKLFCFNHNWTVMDLQNQLGCGKA